MTNCVVSKSVLVTGGGEGSQQFRLMQMLQQQQLKHTWLKYLLAMFLANKNDIIDQVYYGDDHIRAVKRNHEHEDCDGLGAFICPTDALIFTCQRVALGATRANSALSNSDNIIGNYLQEEQEEVDKCSQHRNKLNHKPELLITRNGSYRANNLNHIQSHHRFIKSNSTWTQPRASISLLILLYSTTILLLVNDNATPCLGFSGFELFDGLNFAGRNFPRQLFNLNQSPVIYRQQRQTIADPNNLSFASDQNVGPPQALGGWTSMITGALQGQQSAEHSLDAHVRRILVPRVSGTQGNVNVREYIIKNLKESNYKIELDEFTDSTPIGPVKFANIIASSNPKACRQLVLACHYDSKMMEGFLGAIDSAVPCAMLLKLAKTFNKSFRSNDSDGNEDAKSGLGLRFIFFDGEEAFVEWSSTDSLYGARHLAERWHKQAAPSQCGVKKNELSRIELFVLLDLIGAQDTSFVLYNRDLKHHYQALQKYEKEYLARSGLNSLQARREVAFKNRYVPLQYIEDDHVPFMKRGVPILSLLASPFPKVWHTTNDNYDAIDFARTERILHVLEQFVGNYSNETR